ncbi:DEAD/DEAH box helicase family protein [Lacinutrix sp. C3R15]|uniref:DEAD/DEAH box helicase family protein n=1 Tax=Flavobacteriaceae TaxID=49546 RepID=UPI001C094343|nr:MULTISPECIES: DEAD/DEAH box helicase family protein [Flavobacteriaceae]MBU2940160.1 DEAD/DEAH box helicase family protein [Lacinutrix sp. C3R15]MDO6623477.1 DEAD/DEAH box helicase family protein [Oceanihabitans sp. 1_MG-2023]
MFGSKPINLDVDTNDEFEDAIENGIKIKGYLSEKKDLLIEIIDTCKRVLLHANPNTGKTTFFADLCAEHINNKPKGRIIFISPYIIIQEQFKSRLKSKGVKVDFELNHKNKRKRLLESDKIITSTFQSIYLISNDLNSNDLIIVDECHALFYSYNDRKNNSRSFYFKTINVLHNTYAKLVLMSGTPHQGLKQFLNLIEIKVHKPTVESKIKLEYTSETQTDIIIEFAKRNLKKYGNESLNIIYIKNRKKCYHFKKVLEEKLSVKVLVLTSEEKDTKAYKMLIETSKINKNFQFLITTNVISTGANILNENIGSALMFEEFNPLEIKQFSKRFRNKLDINVDVINPSYTQYTENELTLIEITNQRNTQLKKLKEYIQYFENEHIEHRNLFNYDNSYYDAYEGSISQLKEKLIKRYLIQEVYFLKQIIEYNKHPERLTKLLNKYDDVMTVEVVNKDSYNQNIPENYDDSLIKNEHKSHINQLFIDFIKNPDDYLCALYHYLKSKDSYLLFRFENLFDFFYYESSSPKLHILKKFITPTINKDLIIPLLDLKPYVSDIKKLLYFIKTTNKNKRNSLITSLYFNKVFKTFYIFYTDASDLPPAFEYIDDELVSSTYIPTKFPKIKKKSFENSYQPKANDSLDKKFIKATYNYLIRNEVVTYKDFKQYLLEKNFRVAFNDINKLEFPLNLISLEKSTGRVIDIKQTFIIGLVRSIFRIKSNQTHKRINSVKKPGYEFIKLEPNHDKAKKRSHSEYIDLKKIYFGRINYLLPTKIHSKLDINPSIRMSTNENILLYDYLDKDYYKILDENNK